eukprot:CAMPEP_0175146672 /NCGR_PEP_ID=MMETSP0087-20121206/15511_1 /TAXON_ID=136419 /ORGANISM="Unknown Unknown, Strain D1" /LENGTH=486 /DNA_ID=CAMNT_0016431665 /DNA_START=51 /DNA_END=1511 /DNA_ORIENTATION=-
MVFLFCCYLALIASSAFAEAGVPKVLRFTPDPGNPVNSSLTDLYIAFDRPIMENAEGSFFVVKMSAADTSVKNTVVFSASVRSPSVWVGGHRATRFGATANLVMPIDTLQAGSNYCIFVNPAAFLSSPDAQPWPGVVTNDWCFPVTEHGTPLYPSVIPTSPSSVTRRVAVPLVQKLRNTEFSVNATITHLASYYNRFFASVTGLQAHNWLKQQYQAEADKFPDRYVEITSFTHAWAMPSLIVRIPFKRALPSSSSSSSFSSSAAHNPTKEVIVLGAHLDSINRQNWTQNLVAGRAPGANDDGSGIAVLFEIFKLILQAPELEDLSNGRDIEIHSYSAEEEGLYGSADVAAEYQRRQVRVAAMLMLDQCGFVRNPSMPVVGVFTDNTDPGVTSLLKQLITQYSTLPYVVSNENNRADSDFHSFHDNGYKVGYIAEGPVDDIVYGNSKHTAFDLPTTVNLTHVTQIGGVALAFALEMVLTNNTAVPDY